MGFIPQLKKTVTIPHPYPTPTLFTGPTGVLYRLLGLVLYRAIKPRTPSKTRPRTLNNYIYIFFLLLKFCIPNPYKPSVLFMGRRQTVQTLIRRHVLRRLIRVSTVCLQNVQLKFEYKWKKYHPTILNIEMNWPIL